MIINPYNQHQFLVSVEGNIGAGKSVFLKKFLSSFPEFAIIPEPHEEWQDVGGHNLLDAFYKDTPRWAYSFQQYAFLSRIKKLHKTIASSPTKKNFIAERSVMADFYTFAKACYQRKALSDMEWKMYQEWFYWMIEFIKTPDLFFYLRCSTNTSYERIKKRKREEETEIQLDYLDLLNKYHDEWLLENNKKTVLIIDVEEDFEHIHTAWNKIVVTITNFFATIEYNNINLSSMEYHGTSSHRHQ